AIGQARLGGHVFHALAAQPHLALLILKSLDVLPTRPRAHGRAPSQAKRHMRSYSPFRRRASVMPGSLRTSRIAWSSTSDLRLQCAGGSARTTIRSTGRGDVVAGVPGWCRGQRVQDADRVSDVEALAEPAGHRGPRIDEDAVCVVPLS